MKHDMKKIREAFQRMHDCAVNNGPSYMRIPAEPTNDADLILSAAIDELETLRKRIDYFEDAVGSVIDTFGALASAVPDLEKAYRARDGKCPHMRIFSDRDGHRCSDCGAIL